MSLDWSPLTHALAQPLTSGWSVQPAPQRGHVIIAHADLLPLGVLLPDARAALEAFEEPHLSPSARLILVTDPVLYFILGDTPDAHIHDMTAGAYTAQWLDLAAQRSSSPAPLFADGGALTLAAPIAGLWGLVLRRVGR